MPAKHTYTIGQTAVLVGKPSDALPVSTIRSWAVTFAAHLSPGANPGSNQERRFDDRDVAVLRLVVSLRADRLSLADIQTRLAETTITASETIVSPAPVATDAPQSPVDAPTTALALPAVVSDIEARLHRLETHVAQQSWRKAPALAVGAIVGIVVGALLVLAIVVVLGLAR